jgi:hypothetical protein
MKTFKLNHEPKIESGFKTPENYFETFSARVMQQLPKEEEEKHSKIISLFSKRKSWIYAAAAVLVLALILPLAYNNFYSSSPEIDEATLENYISYNTSISDADLVNLLDEKDIQNMDIGMNIEDISIENELLQNKNLENYLSN